MASFHRSWPLYATVSSGYYACTISVGSQMPLTTLQPIRLRPSPPSDVNASTLGKPYLHYMAVYDWAYRAKRVQGDFLRAIMLRFTPKPT